VQVKGRKEDGRIQEMYFRSTIVFFRCGRATRKRLGKEYSSILPPGAKGKHQKFCPVYRYIHTKQNKYKERGIDPGYLPLSKKKGEKSGVTDAKNVHRFHWSQGEHKSRKMGRTRGLVPSSSQGYWNRGKGRYAGWFAHRT